MIVDIVFGFLGSGKTTFITHVLKEWGSAEKTVVLVNEFGDVGIDGDLLAAQGGNVVEMPSGCICCTLQADFRSQLLEITSAIKPERVIIEPTGVATITQIRSIIDAQLFEAIIRKVNTILIADATGFMELYKANRHFVETQVKNAVIALLNKCDKVEKHKAQIVGSAISAINPEITVMMTEFGVVDREEYRLALSATPHSKNLPWQDDHIPIADASHHDPAESDHGPHAHIHAEEDGIGYETHGCVLDDVSFDKQALETFFSNLSAPEASLGEIVRAKGIFRVGDRGILMELASGEWSTQPMGELKQSKVSIIGRNLRRQMIDAAIKECAATTIQ